jgi:hypothetical protein
VLALDNCATWPIRQVMKRELFALSGTPDLVTTAALGRAIASAPRREPMRVWRTFVRSQAARREAMERTQRIRVVIER